MSNLVIETTVCHGCYSVLDAADNYCRHCGTPSANLSDWSDGERAATSFGARPGLAPSVEQPRWSESPWVVLPLLLLVLGPLALPLLWRSRRFTLLWKGVFTVIMAGVTVFLVWSMWFVVQQSLAPLRELDKLQGLY